MGPRHIAPRQLDAQAAKRPQVIQEQRTLLDRLDVQKPIVQAGMGGGIAGHRLAAAVSEAGGLGTIGMPQPGQGSIASELEAARRLTGRPLAVNLLLPFATGDDFRTAEQADALVTFWGRPRRRTSGVWLHQCGSVDEARAALQAGADGVILQGVEAGGHVRGRTPALDLLADARDHLPHGPALWLAGGIAERRDALEALDSGAEAAVLGTRFLLSEESRAQAAYRERLLDAEQTLLTELFGLGWPSAPHRVVANAATRRWTSRDPRGPAAVRVLNRITAPLAARMPPRLMQRALAAQSAGRPVLGAVPPVEGSPPALADAGPLYAGETVARIKAVRPAAELVRDLSP